MTSTADPIRILFICHGNICRSPMAEFVMKQLVREQGLENSFVIESAATSTEEIGNDVHPGTKRLLDAHDIPYERRHARQLRADDASAWDYLIGMDSANVRNIRRMLGVDVEGKVFKLMEFARSSADVADPWYTGDFETTYADVLEGCRGLLEHILSSEQASPHLQEKPDMDWLEDARAKLRRGNKVLIVKDSPLLETLRDLISQQNHRALVLWALDFAQESVEDFETRRPDEPRPREALDAARDWAAGAIKMRPAQRKTPDCHAVAKELDSPVDVALCHAIGQACSVVHTEGHALGYPMYELTAIIHAKGIDGCRDTVESRVSEYERRLLFWAEREPEFEGPWAAFLQD